MAAMEGMAATHTMAMEGTEDTVRATDTDTDGRMDTGCSEADGQ